MWPAFRRTQPRRIMRIRDVMAELRLSRATVYGMVENGEFPQPIRLSERAVAWRVEGWTSSDSLLRLVPSPSHHIAELRWDGCGDVRRSSKKYD